ncbi:unnamed protein product [Lactuca virosa]|uniref:Uncharacterized protein n=1 Tax=Lactuca virosa TaxID=75947 RepID=A0AAU9LMA5_9ASTR|nr:unnamed protein product [Lactuca virosa]
MWITFSGTLKKKKSFLLFGGFELKPQEHQTNFRGKKNLSFYDKSGYKEAFVVSYACQKVGSNRTQRSHFSLAATTSSNSSRTTKQVWVENNNEGGVIPLCVLRRSRSSHIWRLSLFIPSSSSRCS